MKEEWTGGAHHDLTFHLWGKDARVTTDMLSAELPPKITVIAIGPGGEDLVRYSCPLNDHFHSAGRTGAVMGPKKLKAIPVRSSKSTVDNDYCT